jgi:ribose transport system ATP-binding protein
MTSAAVSVKCFSKSFTGRTVLDRVSLDVEHGEVHALLGQNGSGKSTLIKILAGYHAPDAGSTLAINGQQVPLPLAPSSGRKLGLAFVHQDLGLADRLTVLENLRVGRYDTGRGWRIRWGYERRRAHQLLREFDMACSPNTMVSDLREVDRAMVAILRALEDIREAELPGALILDEPTASLPHDSTERLVTSVRRVAERGVGVLFVTHRLQEALDLSDRVSVLRDGRLVGTEPTARLTEGDLIERVLGFSLDHLYPPPHEPEAREVLQVDGLTGRGVRDVSFRVHRGEIIGLTGLVGMGWERVPYLLIGAEEASQGHVIIDETPYDLSRVAVRKMLASGLALLPANRQRHGSVGLASVMENMSLPTLSAYYERGFLRHRQERRRAWALLETFDVRPGDPTTVFKTLSGGNQQKALLAKWFETRPQVFLMHEPTQGVDIGARQRIFSQITAAADTGTSFILASAEYDDLANLCDRVLVFRNGQIVSDVGGAALTGDRLVDLCLRDIPALGEQNAIGEHDWRGHGNRTKKEEG